MAAGGISYISELHGLVDRYFSLEEVRTLCFDLGIDFDSLGGEGKSARVRELILALARVDRLGELVALAEWQRPNVEWPAVPDNFELPASLASPSAGSVTQNIYQGDVIQGDKVGGDKVGGDKISVGNVSGSGIAIGGGASASVTTGDTYDMSGDFRGANLNIKSKLQDVSQTIGTLTQADPSTKDELQQLILQLNDALQSAPPQKVEQAEEVSEATKLLIEAAAEEKPNPTLFKMMGAGLKQAAGGLKNDLPRVIELTTKIVVAAAAVARVAL
jgi:hypothetical protein